MGYSLPLWPGGNPDDLRAAAASWRTLATTVETQTSAVVNALADLAPHWGGDAAAQFDQYWYGYTDKVSTQVQRWRHTASTLELAARRLEDSQHEYEAVVAVLTAVVVVAFVEVAAGALATGAAAGTVEALAAIGDELEDFFLAEVFPVLVELDDYVDFIPDGVEFGSRLVRGIIDGSHRPSRPLPGPLGRNKPVTIHSPESPGPGLTIHPQFGPER